MPESLIKQLKCLVDQLDDGLKSPCKKPCAPKCPPAACGPPICPLPTGPVGVGCHPTSYPFAQVCMFTPPPVPAPLAPKYVKPLMLPCPAPPSNEPDEEENFRTRYMNYYNNYNKNYRKMFKTAKWVESAAARKARSLGVTVDGKSPICDQPRQIMLDSDAGCPTGFKPCNMKLGAPPCCDPLGTWLATIQPCPPS